MEEAPVRYTGPSEPVTARRSGTLGGTPPGVTRLQGQHALRFARVPRVPRVVLNPCVVRTG
jgi:hypothetical protein